MQPEKLPTPLPKRFIQRVLQRYRYPSLLAGVAYFLPMMTLFFVTGVIYPSEVPQWVADPLELTGAFLMMAVLPAFLLMVWVVATRLSNENHRSVAGLMDSADEHAAIAGHWARYWPLGILFGLINLIFNVGWGGFQFSPADPFFLLSVCTLLGQGFMWLVIGLVLFFAIQESLVLSHLGRKVRVDLYGLERLNGFGRIALNNFLTIAGALALTTLQSLDQEFRWVNYRNGLLITIPAALILVPLPIWAVHRRIQCAKSEHLAELDREIAGTSQGLDDASLHKMNALLVRREQIHKLRNWPMDLSIFTRFLMYVFIVPLAWAGAALMEVLLDNVLGL